MISRVADGCFWMSRYLERVETLARLLCVHHELHIDSALPPDKGWRAVVDFSGQTEDFIERIGAKDLDDGEVVEHYLTWSEDYPASLYGALRGARENARTVREIMSLEAWESINDLWLWMRGRESKRLYERSRSEFYERLMRSTLLFHGVSFGTMLHDEPFTFMKLGRAVERVGLTPRILEAHIDEGESDADGSDDASRCLAALRSCCAYDPFFRSGRPLTARAVTRVLLFDRALPRSVLYNLGEARRLLFELRRDDPVGLPRRSRTALDRLYGELMQMDIQDVERQGVHDTFAWLIRSTARLCDAIHDDYLDPPMAWLRHCVRAMESIEDSPASEQAA